MRPQFTASASPDELPAWLSLKSMAVTYSTGFDLQSAFAEDDQRFACLSLRAPHMLADLSKNLWDEQVVGRLLDLAQQVGVSERRDILFAGGVINDSESQAAIHAAMRRAFIEGGCDEPKLNNYCADLRAMLDLAEELRASGSVQDIVHIGIGGSGLGPELVVQALQPYRNSRKRLHFVSNLDGHDLCEVLQTCAPSSTMFIVASKSWSTAETMRNAQSASNWLEAAGCAPASQMVAITATPDLAMMMGYDRVLRMPHDLGGRFSLWSAVGLPIAVAIGSKGFAELLAGACEMDRHFTESPDSSNLPLWLGLLDVWNASFLQMPSRCVAPYHHGLRRFPAYLQQLEMESNGKRVRRDGTPVGYPTSPAVWGEAGTNGQHAFFQWLHQGTHRAPVEFIVAARHAHNLDGHQSLLLANAIAQSQALMSGCKFSYDELTGHRDIPGNRPSTFLLLDDLSPRALGALLALCEHRAFVAGAVWGINSFDQWGVELGKRFALDVAARIDVGDSSGLDASTAGLIQSVIREISARAPVNGEA